MDLDRHFGELLLIEKTSGDSFVARLIRISGGWAYFENRAGREIGVARDHIIYFAVVGE